MAREHKQPHNSTSQLKSDLKVVSIHASYISMCFRRALFSKGIQYVPDTFPSSVTPDRSWHVHVRPCSTLCIQAYSKLFLELGIVISAQILHMLQECLLVDRPDRREKEHLEGGKKNAPNNVTICVISGPTSADRCSSSCWNIPSISDLLERFPVAEQPGQKQTNSICIHLWIFNRTLILS